MLKITTTQLARALKVLFCEQLNVFFTATNEGNVLALKLIQDSFAEGQMLEEVFATIDIIDSTVEWWMILELKVKRMEFGIYRITVGYYDDGIGDGGVYCVVFTALGEIENIELEEFWMC